MRLSWIILMLGWLINDVDNILVMIKNEARIHELSEKQNTWRLRALKLNNRIYLPGNRAREKTVVPAMAKLFDRNEQKRRSICRDAASSQVVYWAKTIYFMISLKLPIIIVVLDQKKDLLLWRISSVRNVSEIIGSLKVSIKCIVVCIINTTYAGPLALDYSTMQ